MKDNKKVKQILIEHPELKEIIELTGSEERLKDIKIRQALSNVNDSKVLKELSISLSASLLMAKMDEDPSSPIPFNVEKNILDITKECEYKSFNLVYENNYDPTNIIIKHPHLSSIAKATLINDKELNQNTAQDLFSNLRSYEGLNELSELLKSSIEKIENLIDNNGEKALIRLKNMELVEQCCDALINKRQKKNRISRTLY